MVHSKTIYTYIYIYIYIHIYIYGIYGDMFAYTHITT